MVVVKLKCPSCGGIAYLDNKMESGFCVHCGTKIVNEPKPATKSKFSTKGQFKSLIANAKNSFVADDLVRTLNYTNGTSNVDQELPSVDDMDAAVPEGGMGFNQKRFRKY